MPMTIDCSMAMIAPATRLVVGADRPQIARRVLVEGVQRVGREGQADAEQADEELRREHVDDRARSARRRSASGSARAGATSRGARRAGSRCARGRGRPGARARRRRAPGTCQTHMTADVERRPRRPGGRAGRRRARARWRRRVAGRSRTLVRPKHQQDRREVEQQHVLDHVHREELVGERVDGRDQRDGDDERSPREERRRATARRGAPRGCRASARQRAT